MAQVTRENIALCYPRKSPRSRQALVRQSLMETGKTITETAFAWKADHEAVLRTIQAVDNEDVVTRAQGQGRGLILVLPHIGNWEILNHYLGARYGLTHMYQPYRDPAVDALIQAYRSKTGTRFVPVGLSGIRAQLATLKRGGTIGLMPDQEPDVHTGVFRRFFGIEALTGEMIRRFTEQTRCEVVVACCLRTAGGFRVRFTLANINSESDPSGGMNQALEQVINECPDQYLWSYKRFRTRPDGEPELYRLHQSRISRVATQVTTQGILKSSQWIRPTTALLQPLVRTIGWTLGLSRPGLKKDCIRNLHLCRPEMTKEGINEMADCALQELARTGLTLGDVWYGNHVDTAAADLRHCPGGTMVLTPPLGHRERVMRYLAEHYRTMEYYHPNSIDGMDRLIRQRRTAMGIALAPHTRAGELMMTSHLAQGHVVTLCPDQQPRLRGGLFIPLFGTPALTARSIVRMLKPTGPGLVIGVAVWTGSQYQIQFEPCRYDPEDDPETTLRTINEALEGLIMRYPEQYRWSDRRFNIRPPGQPKIYGRPQAGRLPRLNNSTEQLD